MALNEWSQLSEERRYLVDQALAYMDAKYDEKAKLIGDSEEYGKHGTRGSGHYALGLLLRGEPGDVERACEVLHKIIDLQLDAPDEIYHGTFKSALQSIDPPAGNYPWKSLGPGHAYFLAQTFEKITQRLVSGIEGEQAKKEWTDRLVTAIDEVLPPVWKSYDPNWREFISCIFAVILEQFEGKLPQPLLGRMEQSMIKAVTGSIERRLSDVVPMNSNIELMHTFISHYYGTRLQRSDWMEHADREAEKLHARYAEFGSLSEFNTTTYYGVDLTVLGLWRQYGKTAAFQQLGHAMEKGLWSNIADFYNPYIENLSGPFARAYEMEMTAHSSLGVMLYLALGKGYEHFTAINCETEHDIMIALVGVDVPKEWLPHLAEHQRDRLVEQQFRELCERDQPDVNTNLCTASAWIEKGIMMGAMSGSKNTNGQLHPATIHWKTADGHKYDLRLIRREVGKHWNTHLRGVYYEAAVNERQLEIEVQCSAAVDIEFYFEITGQGVDARGISANRWMLPGLTLGVEADAPVPVVQAFDNRLEIIYLAQAKHATATPATPATPTTMKFLLSRM